MTTDSSTGWGTRLAGAYARLVVRLRFVVIGAWLAIALGAFLLPTGSGSSGGLGGLVDSGNSAIAAEVRSYEAFGFPLLSRTTIVQRDPDGLSVYAQAGAVLRAAASVQGQDEVPLVLGALPIPNTLGVFPGAAEEGTTVLTSLFLPPFAGFDDQRRAAQDYAARHLSGPDDALVGVTGSIPARAAQAELIKGALPFVELATVAAIGLLVALAFRSPAAALLALGVAGLAAAVTVRVVGALAAALGVTVPDELAPLLVALLLGVVTDYCVFFLSGLRTELRRGLVGREAVVAATARTAPLVLVAGLTVAAGTGALLVARSGLFRGLGPGLALTVLLGSAVAVTLVPALLGVLGAKALWPAATAAPAVPAARHAPSGTSRLVGVLTTRRGATVVLGLTTAGLLLAALPLLHLRLGVNFIEALPSDSPVAVAAQQARRGFSPGILAPTEVLLEGAGVTGRGPALAQLTDLLRQQPGVDSVLGPGYLPVPDRYGVFLAPSGDAARLLVVLGERPLSAPAIDAVSGLRARLPGLLEQVGLTGTTASLAGDTALSELIVRDTQDDLVRISVAALLANLVMLVLFLRAFWTSVLLLLSSVLALAASLGLTVLLFQDVLGATGLTFYVPFAAAVLLVSLGSDYNIFAVGRVWDEARDRPLVEALRTAVPESSRAITAAALALAASFGLLALVPLRPFRELALAMVLGILIDAVVVRSLLVPSMLTLLGDRARPARTGRLSRVRRPRPARAG